MPEKARLDAIKRLVAADIADDAPAELAAKRAQEAARVSVAQAIVALARRWMASAWDPLERMRAEIAVAQAEQQLRTEYAVRAALRAGPRAARPVAAPAPVAPIERPPAPGRGGAPVWKQAGVFVWHPTAFPADLAIPRLKAQGVKWVALQIADGTTVNAETEAALAAGYIQKLRAAGIEVGFWGVNRTEPEAEARLWAEQARKWGAGFFIANAEIEYKYTSADGSWSPEAFGRSKRFVAAFRQAAPELPAALSTYGRADMADIDWRAWRDAGFDLLPQAYLNEHAINDPKLCVEGAVKAGWPLDRVHPTIGLWGGGERGAIAAAEYERSLRAAGSLGFSSYLAEQMSEADWAGIGQAIARGGLTS